MATIEQALAMQDQITPKLNKIINTVNITINAFTQMNTVVNKGVPASSFKQAESAIAGAGNELEKFAAAENQAETAAKKVQMGFAGWEDVLTNAFSAVKNGGQFIAGAIKETDAYGQAMSAIEGSVAQGLSPLTDFFSNFLSSGIVEQVSTLISGNLSQISQALLPVAQMVVNLVNEFLRFIEISGVITVVKGAISGMATVLGWVLTGATAVFNFINENWNWIGPVVWGIVAAITAYTTGLMAVKTWTALTTGAQIVWNTIKGLGVALSFSSAAAKGTETAATTTLTAAQNAFNAAATANPIGLIIMGIIILIVALILLFYNFTEQIMGAIYWLGELFKGIGLSVANFGMAVWNTIVNVGLWFANLGEGIWAVLQNIGIFFKNTFAVQFVNILKNLGAWFQNVFQAIWNVVSGVVNNIGVAFNNAWQWVKSTFYGFVEAIMSGVKSIAEKINSLTSFFGLSIDMSGINNAIDGAAAARAEADAAMQDFTDLGKAWNDGMNAHAYVDINEGTEDYIDAGAAFNKNEIDWAGGWEDGMNTHGDLWKFDEAYSAGAEVGKGVHQWMDDTIVNPISNLFGGGGDEKTEKDDKNEGGDGAVVNTGGASDDAIYNASITGGDLDRVDEVGGNDEILKYLKDIAKVEYINQYSTMRPIVNANFGDVHETADANQIMTVLEAAVAGAYNSALVRG
ncbi:MAG: hypothetical protein LBM65_07620 [Oscillospiraceae bacterium]|jgi:opacity protein-like surface antigen|nr:hypothetical protein [Oscillospiraceae bacterium]